MGRFAAKKVLKGGFYGFLPVQTDGVSAREAAYYLKIPARWENTPLEQRFGEKDVWENYFEDDYQRQPETVRFENGRGKRRVAIRTHRENERRIK